MPDGRRTAELAAFLKSEFGRRLHGRERLKVLLRPYTCPFDELLTYIEPGSTIFDIGCGPGTFLALALEFSRPRKAVGIDIRPAAVETASAMLESFIARGIAQVGRYDGSTLPVSLSEADTVFLIDVFHYLPVASRALFVSEIYGKMKPGARLVFKDIDAADRLLLYLNKLHNALVSGALVHEVSSKDAYELLRKTGFEVDARPKRRMFWYSHFTLVGRKPI